MPLWPTFLPVMESFVCREEAIVPAWRWIEEIHRPGLSANLKKSCAPLPNFSANLPYAPLIPSRTRPYTTLSTALGQYVVQRRDAWIGLTSLCMAGCIFGSCHFHACNGKALITLCSWSHQNLQLLFWCIFNLTINQGVPLTNDCNYRKGHCK